MITEIGKIYVGQDELVLGSLVALFSSGHVLIESVPGSGQDAVRAHAGPRAGCHFGRIQFTADLMPSDITGAPIFDMKTQEFRFRPGPGVHPVSAGRRDQPFAGQDPRRPAGDHAGVPRHRRRQEPRLERPFLVLATQNPIESEGTYNLPEAQLDRFMFKLVADYPRGRGRGQDPGDAQLPGRLGRAAGASCRP